MIVKPVRKIKNHLITEEADNIKRIIVSLSSQIHNAKYHYQKAHDCARFLTNCIIFYNAYILSVLLTQAEKAVRLEDADIFTRISPIAWQYVNLLGRFVLR